MFYTLLSNKNYCDNKSNDLCLALKPQKNLSYLFNKFNTFSSDISNTPERINNTPENNINSKHYDINKLLKGVY